MENMLEMTTVKCGKLEEEILNYSKYLADNKHKIKELTRTVADLENNRSVLESKVSESSQPNSR